MCIYLPQDLGVYKYLIRAKSWFKPIRVVQIDLNFFVHQFDYSLNFQNIDKSGSVIILELG